MSDRASGGTRRRRWLVAAGGVILLTGVCVVFLFLVYRPRPVRITPRMQTVAESALLQPSMAPIDLGGYPDWYPADGSDYAVENDMVIFPQYSSSVSYLWANGTIEITLPDMVMPAIVYAPDAGSLPTSSRPPIPDGRTWAYIGEWFLYDCHPVEGHPSWWQCQLYVGGNI